MSTRVILGQSPAVKELLGLIAKVAPNKTNVLVIGESGTGKELVARMIHETGPIKDRPFVAVNCGAIPENLIESELFGHKRGSFTGAVSDKPGLFEVANGGTLFLDEVGELPLGLQVKLLRAIQDRTIRRVGGTQDQKIDVRIIAATNRDLEAAVAKGTFREDLYYRLNVILIKTPALRDRKGDVKILADAFLKRFAAKGGRALNGFAPETMAALERFTWPGNIRELENVLERAVTLEPGDHISLLSLPEEMQRVAPPAVGALAPSTGKNAPSATQSFVYLPAPDFTKGAINLDEILSQVEQAYLNKALEASGDVRKKAAELLGITLRSLRYRLQKAGVEAGSTDDSDEEA